jgi:hypothetical protein
MTAGTKRDNTKHRQHQPNHTPAAAAAAGSKRRAAMRAVLATVLLLLAAVPARYHLASATGDDGQAGAHARQLTAVTAAAAARNAAGKLLLTPSKMQVKGHDLFYEAPVNAIGLLLILHKCGRSGSDHWPGSPACKDCLGAWRVAGGGLRVAPKTAECTVLGMHGSCSCNVKPSCLHPFTPA